MPVSGDLRTYRSWQSSTQERRTPRRCLSLSTMTWSGASRRMLPMARKEVDSATVIEGLSAYCREGLEAKVNRGCPKTPWPGLRTTGYEGANRAQPRIFARSAMLSWYRGSLNSVMQSQGSDGEVHALVGVFRFCMGLPVAP